MYEKWLTFPWIIKSRCIRDKVLICQTEGSEFESSCYHVKKSNNIFFTWNIDKKKKKIRNSISFAFLFCLPFLCYYVFIHPKFKLSVSLFIRKNKSLKTAISIHNFFFFLFYYGVQIMHAFYVIFSTSTHAVLPL